MNAATDTRRRLDRLRTDPASIEASYHPEIEALRHDRPEGAALSIVRTVLVAAITLGPTAITTFARHA